MRKQSMSKKIAVVGVAVVALLAMSAVAEAQGVMFVKNNNVGIGTSNPLVPLHIDVPAGDDFAGMGPDPLSAAGSGFNYGYAGGLGGFFNTRTGGDQDLLFGTANQTRLLIKGNAGFGYIAFGTNVLGQTPLYPLHSIDTGAHLSGGGVWTNGSSRAYKDHIADLSLDAARETLMGLAPVTYNYKVEPDELYVGFIAEDVPALVATGDRKGLASMDVVAVLTKVVQDQQNTIDELARRLAELEDQ